MRSPLARLRDLGDVQQAVGARGQVHEGAEGGGLHDLAVVGLAGFRHVRVGDLVDDLLGLLGGLAAFGGDVHGAVILDGDFGAVSSWIWLIILPFGPMTSPILSTGTVVVMMRGAYGLISAGPSMHSLMTSRMVVRASLACCRADARMSAGMPSSLVSSCRAVMNSEVPATLKSMSPKASSAPRMSVSVFVDVLAVDVAGHEAHGDACDRSLQRNASGEQGQRGGADGTHGGGTVGADCLGDLTDGVRELLTARQHRHEGLLGEGAMADLAALRGTDAAGLTGGVRRHLVVVHVALGLRAGQRVDLLLHLEHVQGW